MRGYSNCTESGKVFVPFLVFLELLEIQREHKRLTPTRSIPLGSH